MDDNRVSPEELAAEQAALATKKEEEIRSEIIEEYGFDEAIDAERIDKLVAKEMDHSKKLSGAIGQKISYRNKVDELSKSPHKDNEPAPKTDELTSKDAIAIMNAKVHEDDVDEVVEYAKFKKISVAEALKSDVVKTILDRKSEFRKTSEATNTGTSRVGIKKVSGDELVKDLSQGKIPAPGTKEADELFWARRGGRK